MGQKTCGIIPPRHHRVLGGEDLPGGYLPECILPPGTCYAHVFRLPDGRLFSWEDDFECGCCEPDEDDRCYKVEEISEEELERRISGIR